MRLFDEDQLVWEKTASVELEEDATQWPRQVLTELFRVLPEISEYTPDVKFLKTNEEQGYAIGVVVVTNNTNSALASETAGVQAPKALIPVVIKNGKLSPLDTLMTSSGKMFPLTVDRLREALYRPESFDLITDDWGDAGLWQMFAPPGRDFGTGGSGGPGGAQIMMGPGMKQASLLQRIQHTVLEPDLAAFTQRLADDEVLAKTAAGNPAMLESLETLAGTQPVRGDVAKLAQAALQQQYPADVLLMRYDDDAELYAVKAAHRERGLQHTYYMDRREFLQFAGEKLAAQVDTEGSVVAATSSDKAVVVAGPGGSRPQVIEGSGHYTVFNSVTGAAHRGWVFSGLIDHKGNRLPISLFANEEGASTQDAIAGVYSSPTENSFPRDPVRGQGCFVTGQGGFGQHHATVPLTVKGSTSDAQSIRYNCVDLTGEQLTVVLQRGMESIVAFPGRKELILPFSAGFISTERPAPPLVSSGEDLHKVASALLQGKLTITTVADDFSSYRVQCHQLPKLAAALSDQFLNQDDTVYALCLAGLDPNEAYGALGKVAQTGRCEVLAEDIGALPEVDHSKVAGAVQEVRGLRQNLVKEAASLPDSMTVDAVLSLDFVNSENVRTFISMIPYLEKALNKVCELIFASRLGLTEIPETAASRAARGLNDAIRGLKALALRQIEELP
jgi:hypothetical protein